MYNLTDPLLNNEGDEPKTLPVDNETELIAMMDSNIKFINFRKLWTINKTKWKRCGNLNEVSETLTDTNYRGLKYILINVGVNDLDENNGVSIFNRLNEIIVNVQHQYWDLKIILAEITPRKDDRDGEVIQCNKLINEFARTHSNIYVASHGNLRDEKYTFLHDEKHIKKNCIGRFAANLKRALRKAYVSVFFRMSQNVNLKNSNFTFFDIAPTILLINGQNFSM